MTTQQIASNKDEVSSIWSLAWPTVATNLLFSSVGLVAIRFVAELGTGAVAAAGAGLQVFYTLQAIMVAIGTGITALVARSWGAGMFEEATRITLTSLALGVLLGVLLAAPGVFFATSVASIFGLDEQTTALAAEFILWLSIFNVAFAVNITMGTALRAAGDAKTPLWLAAFTNVLNLLLLYPAIFGIGPIPAQGVAGAAQAAGIAFTCSGLLIVWLWVRNRLRIPFAWLHFFERRHILDLFHISYPSGMEQIVLRIGFFSFMIIISQYYGAAPFAAYNVGVTLLSFCFVVGFGFSIAGATLVGQNLGRNDLKGAERAGWSAMKHSILSMALIGVTIILLAEPIARLIVDDEQVVHYTVIFIYILGSVQPLMAIDFAIGGALRGAGDTRFPLRITMIGLIGVRVVCAFMAVMAGLSVEWVYATLIGDYMIKAVLLIVRFRSNRWQLILSKHMVK